jgi:dephospho-CoA kinase
MFIIGLCGKMGSGKDYIANRYIFPFLKRAGYNACQMSFADQIKVNVMVKNDIPFGDVYVEKTDSTRTLLQQEGTEHGRDVLGKEVWIKYFDAWSKVFQSRGIDAVVATDVRFANEFNYIKARGIVIKVDAPLRNQTRLIHESKGDSTLYVKMSTHSSECDLDNKASSAFDIVIPNDIDDECLDETQFHRQLIDLIRAKTQA